MTGDQLASIMPEVARHFWGEPNPARSTRTELRWGSNGARSVDLAKGAWFDFEANEGGGVLDLLKREHVAEPWQWLRENGFAEHRDNGAGARPKIVATYDYTDETGALLFQVVRLDPKTFRQRRPARAGRPAGQGEEWLGVEREGRAAGAVPPARAASRRSRSSGAFSSSRARRTFETLARHGITATCNAGGAGKWRDEFAEHLVGADVVILPDNDAPGREHADVVARSLTGKAARIRVVDLPGLPEKGDVSDWFAAGGTVEAFNELDRGGGGLDARRDRRRSQTAQRQRLGSLSGTLAAMLNCRHHADGCSATASAADCFHRCSAPAASASPRCAACRRSRSRATAT